MIAMKMKRERGVALTEFALVLPMLLILMLVTMEFGRAYYQFNMLTKSVREAARYLSVRTPGVDKDKAKNIIVYGNPSGTGSPQIPGLSLSNVPDPTWGTAGAYPTLNTVTVTVSGYTYKPLVKGVSWILFDNITFGPVRATMRSPS
jgi:Flp pilus assembly protein TadG